MAAVEFAAKLKEDGSLAVPKEAVEELGLHPGDELQVRIEAINGTGQPDYDRILAELFAEVEALIPEPGKPLSDPYEAAWGAGVEEKFRKMGFKL
jgi:antitoxin component of MazEF toxin-antitoxin module